MSPQSMAGVRWNLTTHTASLQEPQAWLGPATMGMPTPPTCPTDALPRVKDKVAGRGGRFCRAYIYTAVAVHTNVHIDVASVTILARL